MTGTNSIPIGAWSADTFGRAPWILLVGGILFLLLALLALMLSRWGQVRPLSKCVVLSVIAHIILIIYAYMTDFFEHPIARPGQSVIKVRVVTEDQSARRPIAKAWEKSDVADVPELHDILPREPEVDEVQRTASDDHSEEADLHHVLDVTLPEQPLEVIDEPTPHLGNTTALDAAPINAPQISRRLRPDQIDPTVPAPKRVEVDSNPSIQRQHRNETPTDLDTRTLADLSDSADTPDAIAATRDRLDEVARELSNSTSTSGWTSSHSSNIAYQFTGQRSSPKRLDDRRIYQSRKHPNRVREVIRQGGSQETEAAVAAALQWLAKSQHNDGRWDTLAWEGGNEMRSFAGIDSASPASADTAVTGLAVLAFLGAGHTHQEGQYKDSVQRGLTFLMKSQSSASGSLAGRASRFVAMYCHGIATLAISEAYIMTGDRRLRSTLRRAIDYTIASQHPTSGGWRYQPGDVGDTSQFGWQLMALISAKNAGLPVPEKTESGMHRWLQRVALGTHGGLACYRPNRRVPSHTMTAEALVCRLFLDGGKDRQAVNEAASYVAREGVGSGQLNLYYLYYATLALFQMQDHRWVAWNDALKPRLLNAQITSGPLAGSWEPNTRWGAMGGRVYSTALATLCLETYCRYLPFYDNNRLKSARGAQVNTVE